MFEGFNIIQERLQPWLGLGVAPDNLDILQVCLRGLVVFASAIVIVRLADKRFLSRKTAFDAVLFFMLASMLSRAINGSASMLPTMLSALLMVLAHRLLTYLSWRSHWVGQLIKGTDEEIIQDGQVQTEAMQRLNFSDRDLLEYLRLKGVDQPQDVKMARLERSGELSVVRKQG